MEMVLAAMTGAAVTLAIREVLSGRVLVRMETQLAEMARRLLLIEADMRELTRAERGRTS